MRKPRLAPNSAGITSLAPQRLVEELRAARRRIVDLEELVDERQRAESMLRESETKYASLVEQSNDAVLVTQDSVVRFASQAVEGIYGYTPQEMIGMKFFPLVAPEWRDIVIRRYEARVAGQAVPPAYETKIVCKDGTLKDVEVSSRRVDYEGKGATLAIVRDIAYRKEVEQKMVQRSRELAGLHSVLLAIAQTLDLQTVLNEIAHHVGVSLDSRYTLIVMVNDDGTISSESEYLAGGEELPQYPHPMDAARRVASSQEPVIVSDVTALGETDLFHSSLGIESYAAVPVKSKEATIGVLLVHSPNRNAFSDKIQLLAAFANQAAIAIENARLYETVLKERSHIEQLLDKVITAQEDERRRLALDIHDTVTQSMYGVLAHLGAARELLTRGDRNGLEREIVHARAALEHTLSDLRRVAADLHPPTITKTGVVSALRQHIDDCMKVNRGIKFTFDVTGKPYRFTAQGEMAVYRIVQEATNNARKHAAPSRVEVRLAFLTKGVSVEVRDNGRGFAFSKQNLGWATDGCMGLLGMIERAELLGGTLQVDTLLGSGTAIKVFIPASGLDAPQASAKPTLGDQPTAGR
jgi:PAS domain S-box-containing protein